MIIRVWHGLAVLWAVWVLGTVYTRGMVDAAAASGIDVTYSWWALLAFNTVVVATCTIKLLSDRRA